MRIRTGILIASCLLLTAGLISASAAGAATITVTTAADQYGEDASNCGLREAVQAANDDQAFGGCQTGSAAPDTINVPQGVQLTRNGVEDANVNGDLDITSSSLTITGTGPGEREIRNDGGGDRVLHVASGLTGVAISNVSIKGGDAGGGDGGGILNAGTLTLSRSSLTGNFAGGNGGGIHYTGTGTGAIVNATISGNVTNGSGGGGIGNAQPTAFQPDFRNVTITNNTADQDVSGLEGSGGYAGFAGGAQISNSILAGNIDASPGNPNCGGAPAISGGYNIAGADCGLTGPSDTTTLSGLAALAYNGGNSLTHALQAGSPAINTGNPGPGGFLCATTDQREEAREGACDRGAYEFITPAPAPSVTDSDPDSPANDNNPEIKGTAQAGTTVQLFTDAGCATAIGASAPASAFASPGITVTVADNTTTTLYAQATNGGGPSPCSAAPLTYQEVTPSTGGGNTTPITPISPVTPVTPAPKKCKKGQKLKKGKCVKKKRKKKRKK